MAHSEVVVIGDVLIDELVDSTGSTAFPGGSALNVAVGLAILGVPVTLVGSVGDDDDGEVIRQYLRESDVRLIGSVAALGTGRAISDRTDAEPTYRFNRSSQNRQVVFDERGTAALEAAEIIAVSGFPCDDRDQVAALVEITGRSSALLAVDANPREGLLRDRQEFRSGLERLSRSAELVKLGEDDIALLYDESLRSVALRYLDLGAHNVLSTAGANGAAVYRADGQVSRSIAVDPRPVVDTMGAGDATFATAIHALWARGPASDDVIDWGSALERAMAVAAETIRFPGALLRIPRR